MEGILDHVIRNKDKLCKDQLLIYVKEKREVRKSHVIYALEMGFILVNKKNELIISAPI